MSSPHWARALAQAAYERGWLTSAALKKALLLVEVGLHPEQAFIGTGLLTAERYAMTVEQLWQVRLQRLDVDLYTLQDRNEGDLSIVKAHDEAGNMMTLRTDVWAQPGEPTHSERVIDVFRSDVLRWLRSTSEIDLSVSEWMEAWSTIDATELRLGVEHGRGVVLAGAEQAHLDDGCIKSEEIPALQTWFEAGYGSRLWGAVREPGLESDWVELVARHDRHPLTKAASWQQFLRQPTGVLYLSEPDAWLRRKVAVMQVVDDHRSMFSAVTPYRIHPLTKNEREMALHGALAGKAMCWIDDTGESLVCMRQLAKAGVPVTIVRSRPTLHGTGWEVYSLSV